MHILCDGCLVATFRRRWRRLSKQLLLARGIRGTGEAGAQMMWGVHLQDPLLAPGSNVSYVCLGDEWHRFPSSFHLPAPAYRLAFVKSGFRGLLPRPFDLQQVLAHPLQLLLSR